MSKNKLGVFKEYINKNLATRFIKEFTSRAKAFVLFVFKKSRKLRLVVDYKGINNITIKDKYFTLLLQELNNKLKRAIVFTKLD